MNRRELLTGLRAAAAMSALSPELRTQTAAPAAGGWPIKPLPFDPKKLKGLLTLNLSGTGPFDKLASGIRKCLDSIALDRAGKTGGTVRSEFTATNATNRLLTSLKPFVTRWISRSERNELTQP